MRRFRVSVSSLVLLFACGSSDGETGSGDEPASGASSGGGTAPGSSGSSGTTPPSAEPPPPPVIGGGDCDSGEFEIREIGKVAFQGTEYQVVSATPCEYVLSHARKGKTYAVEETATHYVVDSQFELPYLPGVMDTVAFTPGEKNLGWANGFDVRAAVTELGGLPLLYHVRPDYEYGYFTKYDDDLGDIFGAFRPTWRFVETNGSLSMLTFQPPDPAWPRHRGGWNARDINKEIGFGFYVDTAGKVYVPKGIPFGRQEWNEELRCVVINQATSPVPVTRTQFPGDESYYMSHTMLPGYASVSSPGHLYWGHKGKPMRDVAKWDETLPGNFDKPFGGGCSFEGYSVAHAEGFTWPELRDKQRDKMRAGEIAAIPKENLYRVSVYVQEAPDREPELHGSLWYEWKDDVWLPKSSGDKLISLDASRDTFRISGYVPEGKRAFVVIQDL